MVHAYRLGGMLRVDTVQLHHPAGEKKSNLGGGMGPGAEGWPDSRNQYRLFCKDWHLDRAARCKEHDHDKPFSGLILREPYSSSHPQDDRARLRQLSFRRRKLLILD